MPHSITEEQELEQTVEKHPEAINEATAGAEPADYLEFLTLNDHFQGAQLKHLTRKIDWHVIPVLFVMYLLSYIDRSNVGNARLFGVEADLGMSGTDWNLGLSLLFITYALGGPPFNALLKKIGPRYALGGTFLGVAVTVVGAGCCSNRASWFALRLLLGLFEAGIYVGCAFVLTTWYTPAQLHSRLSYFYLGATASGGLSGLLAYGIGQLDHKMGYRGWRFIYVIEGVFSVLVAIVAFFIIQDAPERRRKWLNDEEQRYIILRNRYAYGKDKSGSKDEFSWRDYLSALKSWHVYTHAFSFFCFCTAIYGFSLTLPTIIANMGFSAANAQALSAPPYIFACFCLVLCGWYSDTYKKRMISCLVPSIFAFIGLIICVTTAVYKNLVALTYIGVCLACGGLYCLTPAVSAWIGLNTAGQAKRGAGMAIGVFASQLGGILGSNIYLANEKPRYPTGFGLSLALLAVGNLILPVVYWVLVGRVNRQREAMSDEEIRAKYTPEELTAMGDKSPYYRYER